MNQCNQKPDKPSASSSFLNRPTSLQDVISTPYEIKSKEIEDILFNLKDSPSLKQALLNASKDTNPDLTNQLSQVLNSPIDQNLLKALSLATNPSSATTSMAGNTSIFKTNSSNLLASVGGQFLQLQQPNDAVNASNIQTILNLCQQQNSLVTSKTNQPANSVNINNQPQLILLTNPNVSNFNPTQQGQSFPLSLAPQNTFVNLNNAHKPNENLNQTKLDEEDSKKMSLKREISSTDSMDSVSSAKSRRRKLSPNRLATNNNNGNGIYQDSSGCLSPSAKTNYSIGSPKDGESNSSANNHTYTDDPFEKSRLMRLEKKRARNRDAAKKCRERKLTLIRSLEVHVAQLVEDNKGLKARLSKSRSEVERLKNFVVEHLEKDCQFINKINPVQSAASPTSPTSSLHCE